MPIIIVDRVDGKTTQVEHKCLCSYVRLMCRCRTRGVVIGHRILVTVTKYHGYGIGGKVQKFISSFLADRNQRVTVGGKISGLVSVTSGVPQALRVAFWAQFFVV